MILKLPTTPSFRLDNKTALIAGASSGIGLACAVALADAGAEVVLASRNIEALQKASDAIKLKGNSVEAVQLDIADTDAIELFFKNQKPFDILVNSAGMGCHSPSLETSTEDFDEVMDVNLRGAYFLTQAVARGLIKAKKTGLTNQYFFSNGSCWRSRPSGIFCFKACCRGLYKGHGN